MLWGKDPAHMKSTLSNQQPSLRARKVRHRLGDGPAAAALFLLLLTPAFVTPARSQESPYIVTYDHYLEEPGSLEVEYFSTFGTQRGGNDFHSFWTEFEYGATGWWTTEFYLSGQTTFH